MVQVVEGREQRARPVSQPSCCWNTGSSCTGDWSTLAAMPPTSTSLTRSSIKWRICPSVCLCCWVGRLDLLLHTPTRPAAAATANFYLTHSVNQEKETSQSPPLPTSTTLAHSTVALLILLISHSCWRKAGSAATPQHVLLLPLSRERSDCLVHPCLVQCCACLPVCLSWQCAWLWCQLCNKWLNCLWCLSSPAFCC